MIIKRYCSILFLFLVSFSCHEKDKKTSSIKYLRIALTAYSFQINDSIPNQRDLYVSSFWQIDSLGKCEMVRRDGAEKEQKYFVTNLSDSTIQRINTLNLSKPDTADLMTAQKGGDLYCLAIYKKDGTPTEYIRFVPWAMDGEMVVLFNSLTKIMAEAKTIGMFPANYYQNINYIKKNFADTTF